ncbi:Mitochondrial import inner membrane translocase subunit Tim10 [Durusdinium trenchii]|uniref:Mitochondrial import inner membrane translocase subunit Tim10 n=1 Tax=Durusdinium trenchii TaxID=1381693 RepID=A0ABP0MUD9_9DINO
MSHNRSGVVSTPKDVKVAVIDGLLISLESLHERKAKRLRRGAWTSLKRRLEVQHLRLAAAHLTGKATNDAMLDIKNLSLDLVEGRDIGRRQDHRNPSARMAMLPRLLRMNLTVPEIQLHLNDSEILNFIKLVGHIVQPKSPPVDMLSAEVQEQTKAAVEALSTRSIRSFSIFRRSKKDKKPKSSVSDRELGTPVSQIADMAADMADIMATKAKKAGDAASAAAADKARRTAAAMAGSAAAGAVAGAAAAAAAAQGASHAAQKASHALGDARRSGQAAAEKAFGSLMRVGLGRKTKKEGEEVPDNPEDEELRRVLALSLKEFEDSQAAQAQKESGYPDLTGSPKAVSACESVVDDQAPSMCGEELDDMAALLASSDSDEDDRQSVDFEEDIGVGELEVVDTHHGRDAPSAFMDSHTQPPLGLRMLFAHIALSKLSVTLPTQRDSEGFRLEAGGLNISGDTLLRLLPSEIKCLRRLGILQGHSDSLTDTSSSKSQSSNCSMTLCSGSLKFDNRQLLGVKRLPKFTPWMLTVRLNATSLARPLMTTHKLALECCTHGVHISPYIDAIKALQARCASLQKSLSTLGSKSEGIPGTAALPLRIQIDARLRLQHTMIDLSHISSPLLRPLQVLIPCVQINVSEGFLGLSPPVPQWHVLPTSSEGNEPDFHLYDCFCVTKRGIDGSSVEPEADSKSFEGWEVLVTERQWCRSGTGLQGQRLLLPAAEMLLLSKSKLEAMEAAHRLEDLAERQHAESCFAIQKGTAQRLPIVQEILDGTAETTIDGLEEQLEALRVELRSLDSQRREDELALKRSEREVATEVADFRYQKLQREQDLQQQLQEEEMISDALTKLIADQAEIIAKLQSFD